MDTISIYDLSVTEQNLQRIAGECKAKIEAAKAMACTEETKQAVKNTRSELKKQFTAYEEERKARTTEYEKPLKEFKAMYDKYIKNPFEEADRMLKDKIDEVENAQKSVKHDKIKSYAKELIVAYGLNWLDVDGVMPKVTLSKSISALEQETADIIGKIKDDVDCINEISDGEEVFAEYMKCLSLSKARLAVDQRKREIERARRQKEVYAQQEEVKQEAAAKVEQAIKQLAPPVVEEVKEEKKYQMTFTVTGTLQQLKAIKAFLVENQIEFKNGGNNNG